jgi:hypothetical protein
VAVVTADDRVRVLDLGTGTFGPPIAGVATRDDPRLHAANSSGAGTDPLSYYAVAGCGPLVCVVADDTVALDPTTGAVRWRAEPAMYTDVPGGVVADFGWSRRTSIPPVLAVADPRTGEVVAAHQGWRLLGVDPDRGRLLVGRIDASTTELAWLDGGAPGSVRPIDMVGDLFESCRAARLYLACRSQRGIVRIWRLRP